MAPMAKLCFKVDHLELIHKFFSQLTDVDCHCDSLLPDFTPDLCHWTAVSL